MGQGGLSLFGSAGGGYIVNQTFSSHGYGYSASGYGAGGSGGYDLGFGAADTGGNGSAGLVMFEW
jgi:hypothetical protein